MKYVILIGVFGFLVGFFILINRIVLWVVQFIMRDTLGDEYVAKMSKRKKLILGCVLGLVTAGIVYAIIVGIFSSVVMFLISNKGQ